MTEQPTFLNCIASKVVINITLHPPPPPTPKRMLLHISLWSDRCRRCCDRLARVLILTTFPGNFTNVLNEVDLALDCNINSTCYLLYWNGAYCGFKCRYSLNNWKWLFNHHEIWYICRDHYRFLFGEVLYWPIFTASDSNDWDIFNQIKAFNETVWWTFSSRT